MKIAHRLQRMADPVQMAESNRIHFLQKDSQFAESF